MELEILNYQIINVRIDRRTARNRKFFDFSSSEPFKVYIEVKEEIINGNSGDVELRLKGPEDIIQMIKSGDLTFKVNGYDNAYPEKDRLNHLFDIYERSKYGKPITNMSNDELLDNNLITCIYSNSQIYFKA